MHMANELLSGEVALGTYVVAGGALAFAAHRLRARLSSELVPLMGVMGAFIFAAQMINFTLPSMAGTSDHLIGTVLLAILLGPHAALIAITGVLVVQCLIFQDGGLLALGANVINMGVLPAYVGYGIWRVLIGRPEKLTIGRLVPVTWAAGFVGVTLGAVAVCVQVALADRLSIPVATFSSAMVVVHLLSGAIEGAITCVVLVWLYRIYPELSHIPLAHHGRRWELRSVVGALGIAAVVIGGFVSWFASVHPDGLEWALARGGSRHAVAEVAKPADDLVRKIDELQAGLSPLPDYSKPAGEAEAADATWPNVNFWTSVSGLVGLVVTMVLIYAVSSLIRRDGRVQTG